MLEGRLALPQFASATFFFLPHLFQVPFSVLFLPLSGSVEPQLFKLTSYLPKALFLLLCRPVMSQPPQNRHEINDSLRTGAEAGSTASPPPSLHPARPTCNPLPLRLFLFLALIPSARTERTPTPPYQLEPITELPC